MELKKFNLSEKIVDTLDVWNSRKKDDWIYSEDVKEFIKRLKEDLWNGKIEDTNDIIDKLAGEKLR
jgi:hypothetical protein